MGNGIVGTFSTFVDFGCGFTRGMLEIAIFATQNITIMNNYPPPYEYQIVTNRRVRESNMELFRCVAMFLVLVVHSDFFSLGAPSVMDYQQDPKTAIVKMFFEILSIGCVDMFVLLSGWFSIKPKLRSFMKFMFQCFFFYGGIYAVFLFGGHASFSIKEIYHVLLGWNWFPISYIGLYILAPVLNVYVERCSQRQLLATLVSFYVFQSVYSWICGVANFFCSGYSTMSFIGLYLLARYVRIYPSWINRFGWLGYIGFFLATVVGQTILSDVVYRCGFSGVGRICSYVNPLVIIASLSLLLAFSKLRFQSRFVNWLGASCFAVFLIHVDRYTSPYFRALMNDIYAEFNGAGCIAMIFVAIVCIFAIGILVDQMRIWAWEWLWPHIEKVFRHKIPSSAR